MFRNCFWSRSLQRVALHKRSGVGAKNAQDRDRVLRTAIANDGGTPLTIYGAAHCRITAFLRHAFCVPIDDEKNYGTVARLAESSDRRFLAIRRISGTSTPAMTLGDFTSPGMIIPRLRGDDAASVIQELSQALQREKRIPNLLPFYQAALNREFMVSTDMEAGMAFPHARLPALDRLSFALGRSEEPLSWGPRAARSVRLVFLMAVPATDSTQYLLLISGLVRLAKESRLVEQLHLAQDTFQILEVLQQVELRTGSMPNTTRKALTRPC